MRNGIVSKCGKLVFVLSVLNFSVASAFAQSGSEAVGNQVEKIQAQQLKALEVQFQRLTTLATQQASYAEILNHAARMQGGAAVAKNYGRDASGYFLKAGFLLVPVYVVTGILSRTQLAGLAPGATKFVGRTTLAVFGGSVLGATIEYGGERYIMFSEGQRQEFEAKKLALQGVIETQKQLIAATSQNIGAKWNPKTQVLDFSGVPALPPNLRSIVGNTGGILSLMDLTKLITAASAN